MSLDIDKVTNRVGDAWEGLTTTQTSRTGHAAARVASALANNVAPEVVALQMTMNSQKNTPVTFTADDILAIAKFHAANKTRSALTKSQTGTLIRQQRCADTEGELSPVC